MPSKKIELELNESEQVLLLAALAAVSPTGGGSPQFTLLRKLSGAMPGHDKAAIDQKAEKLITGLLRSIEDDRAELDDFNSTASRHHY